MKTTEEFRQEETKRLLEWIKQNQEDWRQICDTQGEGLELQECMRLIKELKKQSFYEIILVLLTANIFQRHVAEITTGTMLNRILETWDEDTISTMTNYITNALSLKCIEKQSNEGK
ncbi:MAG: hypothetical protein WHF31_00430 [Candidatus Dehalobacter alkaniphilus]